MNDHYQTIGDLLTAVLPSAFRKALLYAEVEDGVVGTSLFHEDHDGRVFYSPTPPQIVKAIYAFWIDWKGNNNPWRTFAYLLEGGRFRTELKYPDQIPEDEEEWERRPRILREHFAGKEVIYPNR